MILTQRRRRSIHPAAVAFLLFGLWLGMGHAVAAPSDAVGLVGWSGETMGTTYSVKIHAEDFAAFDLDQIKRQVERELARVNLEMSTYDASSEISRFNQSQSLDWFPVSPAFAQVVSYAQQVARQTDGAFDITVGPVVDRWGFGAKSNDQGVPSQAELQSLADSVGYQRLEVRTQPPSLRKEVSSLRIDLSAIAKGHGVDRVLERMRSMGLENAFVEIGGEIRVMGSKAGDPWRVGIQVPDASINDYEIAVTLGDQTAEHQAIATSGDYRNFVQVDGVRYSHTIDPKTFRPIRHNLASVSVVAGSCMKCDAWATALSVMGEDQGGTLAEKMGLSTLLLVREPGEFRPVGTGHLAVHTRQPLAGADATGGDQTWAVMGITFVAFAVLLFGMAVGVIFRGKAISGSCGGIAGTKSEDGQVSCSLCSNPADACKELRDRMRQGG